MTLPVVVVSGSRTIRSYWLFSQLLRSWLRAEKITDCILLQGEANFGVDCLARIFAKRNGLQLVGSPANWDVHGRKAGMLRNDTMANRADYWLAFWDGESSGTSHGIKRAKAKNLPATIFVMKPHPFADDKNIETLMKSRRLGIRVPHPSPTFYDYP